MAGNHVISRQYYSITCTRYNALWQRRVTGGMGRSNAGWLQPCYRGTV